MNILRRFGLSIVITLFSLLIFILALFVSIRFVLDTPPPLEKALASSGIYDVFVHNLLANQKQGSDSSGVLQNLAVQQSMQQTFTPTYLKANTEKIIDSTYSWVHGTTAKPIFAIDLGAAKNTFAGNIGNYVRQKVGDLPVCKQAAAPPADLEGVLALTCRPANVSVDQIVASARDKAVASGPFKDSANTLSADNLKDSSGRTFTDKLALVPKVHRYYILSLYIIPVAALLCALAIIYWGKTRRKGIKHIARTLITTGIISIIVPIAAVWLLNKLITHLDKQSGVVGSLQSNIVHIATSLATDLRIWWVAFGAGYTLIGIALFLVLHFTKTKEQANTPQHKLDYARYTPPAGTKFNPGDTSTEVDDSDK